MEQMGLGSMKKWDLDLYKVWSHILSIEQDLSPKYHQTISPECGGLTKDVLPVANQGIGRITLYQTCNVGKR